jgi:hypothetical protein
MFCADNVNIFGGSVHVIKKSTESLLVGIKQVGLGANVDKTKYMIMSADKNPDRRHDINIDNRNFGRIEEVQY